MDRCIVILGFMASGKTTLGQELARKLGCEFIDLDSLITERAGRSPAEIIEQDGENTFRQAETLAFRDVLQGKNAAIVALGGGTWTIPAIRTLTALHNCRTIWLDAPFELCWERIDRSETDRPLAPNREAAMVVYASRLPDYALAQQRIAVDSSSSPEQLADEILRQM